MRYAPVHNVLQLALGLSLAGAATATVEREQLIGHAYHENCDIHSVDDLTTFLSMNMRDCIRYKNTLKCRRSLAMRFLSVCPSFRPSLRQTRGL